jgi:hypothetical protein
MKRLPYWLAGICVWFFFLYNIEKVSGPVNIATFVYLFTIVSAVLIILVRPLQKVPLYWTFLVALLPFFFFKIRLGYAIGGENLPITVTEICAIGLTIVLTGQMARSLQEMREAVTSLTISHLIEGTQSFAMGQGRIYGEIRRARLYKRPAALLAISVADGAPEISLNRYIQEAQREIINKYIAARVANLLVEELKDCDVITQREAHFITLLPETSRENVLETVKKLETAAKEKLGLELKIGLSTFPDEAVTFESLLEQAEAKMRQRIMANGSHVEQLSSTNAKSILQL